MVDVRQIFFPGRDTDGGSISKVDGVGGLYVEARYDPESHQFLGHEFESVRCPEASDVIRALAVGAEPSIILSGTEMFEPVVGSARRTGQHPAVCAGVGHVVVAPLEVRVDDDLGCAVSNERVPLHLPCPESSILALHRLPGQSARHPAIDGTCLGLRQLLQSLVQTHTHEDFSIEEWFSRDSRV